MCDRRTIHPSTALVIALVAVVASPRALAQAPADAAPAQDPAEAQPAPRELAVDDDTCLGCHGDDELEPESERGKGLKLYQPEDALAGSAHEGLGCTDCHGGGEEFEEVPHAIDAKRDPLCGSCHDEVMAEYARSVHGAEHAKGEEDPASCTDCHGGHDILPASDRRSLVNKFNLSKTCASCHQNTTMMERHDVGAPQAVAHFIDSMHGKALLVDGLVVAPSCNDCHGVHDILPHENPDSHISKENTPDTCGACHVLVEEVYNKSVHGRLMAAGDPRGPTCKDCHSSHKIGQPTEPEFRLSIDATCGGCHADRLKRYRESFHGKAIALGRANVAACFDCHGHHDIEPSSDPRSHVSAENRLETCARCHPDANPGFAEYLVHSDHTDREGSPQIYWVYVFMTALLIGTFLFFAVHSLLWLVRSAVLYLRDPKTFREAKNKARTDDEEYVRFRPVDRFLHGLVIFSFLLLVVTGMPLKFFDAGWARWLFDLMGGQAVAAVLHRIGAFITIFYFVVHVFTLIMDVWKHRRLFRDPGSGRVTPRQVLRVVFGPDSPMPNLQDLREFWAHQKWFFGKGEKPQFDRWTYWEKFDYFAVFWGVFMIGMSGLIMWIPEVFTTVLPGWTINVALVVHSDEALLAAGFIFTFHFFNVHFRLEKFPMDPIIFSGRISKTELLHERRRQYDRWEREGVLEEKKVKDEWRSWRFIALPAGFLAFVIGVGIVVLIYAAMYSRLVHG